jgi:hypothetical protein
MIKAAQNDGEYCTAPQPCQPFRIDNEIVSNSPVVCAILYLSTSLPQHLFPYRYEEGAPPDDTISVFFVSQDKTQSFVLGSSQHLLATLIANPVWRFAMARKANEARLAEVQRILQKNQGEKASYYARTLGMHRYDFNTMLAMLDERGFRLWEDEKGCLWLFGQSQDDA